MKKEKKTAQEKVEKKKIKNYILLVVIFALAIALTLYFCKWYNVYDEYQKQTPVISDTLTELSNEEIEHYIIDNPTAVIYMCTSSELKCRNFEKDFKKLIKNENLQDKIVYQNLSNLDIDSFYLEFNAKYQYKKELNNYPAIIVFEDGKVSRILQGTKEKELNISQVKQFVEMSKIGE